MGVFEIMARLYPSQSNRLLMVEKLRADFLKDVPDPVLTSVAMVSRKKLDELSRTGVKQAVSAGIAASGLAMDLMGLAVQRAYADDSPEVDATLLREAMDCAVLGASLIRHELGNGFEAYQQPACEGSAYIFAWSFLLQADLAQAEILGRHIFNWYRSGLMDVRLDDPLFGDFMWLLVKSSVTQEWAGFGDGFELGSYSQLLACTENPEAFSIAASEALDYRLARTWGFDRFAADAKKVEGKGELEAPGRIFALGWPGLYPLELLALQVVVRQTTGKTVALPVDHPLIQLGMLEVPDISLLPLSTTGELLQDYGIHCFGSNWNPGSKPALLEKPA